MSSLTLSSSSAFMMSVLIAIRLRTSQTLLFLSRMMPRRRCSGPTDLLASRVASSRLYASISDTFGENWLVILVCILSFLLLLCKIISFLCDIMQSLCQKILNQQHSCANGHLSHLVLSVVGAKSMSVLNISPTNCWSIWLNSSS